MRIVDGGGVARDEVRGLWGPGCRDWDGTIDPPSEERCDAGVAEVMGECGGEGWGACAGRSGGFDLSLK